MTNRSQEINELAAAMAQFQSKIGSVAKDKTANIPTKAGGSYSYSYADLSSIWDAIRAPLSEAGLSVVQMPEIGDGMVFVSTLIMHTSGQWLQSTIGTRAADATPQAIGSAITYLRRYGLGAMLGVVTDIDNDGQQPPQRPQPPRVESRRQSVPVPQSRRQAPERIPSPNREGMIKRINDLTRQAQALKLEVVLKKQVVNMTNEELIAHGKALSAAIDLAEGGSPQ